MNDGAGMFTVTACGKAVGSSCALQTVRAGKREGTHSFGSLAASGDGD